MTQTIYLNYENVGSAFQQGPKYSDYPMVTYEIDKSISGTSRADKTNTIISLFGGDF